MARTEEHFIWTGDYAGRLAAISAAAEAAHKDTSLQLLQGEEHPYETLKREREALRAEAEEQGLRLIVRGLRDDEWDALVDAHPPRTDEQHAEADKNLGYNERTGLRDMVLAGVVDPSFKTRSAFDDWVIEHDVTRGDLMAVAMRIWRMTNGSGPIDPKLLAPLPALVDE